MMNYWQDQGACIGAAHYRERLAHAPGLTFSISLKAPQRRGAAWNHDNRCCLQETPAMVYFMEHGPGDNHPGSRCGAQLWSLDEDPKSAMCRCPRWRLLAAAETRQSTGCPSPIRHLVPSTGLARSGAPLARSAPCSACPIPRSRLRLAGALPGGDRVILYGRGLRDVWTVDGAANCCPRSEVETPAGTLQTASAVCLLPEPGPLPSSALGSPRSLPGG